MLVKGYASHTSRDTYGHLVEIGAFAEAIARRGFTGTNGIKLLAQHKPDRVIGQIKVLGYDDKGLLIAAEIDERIGMGREVAAMVRANEGLGFSVGFQVVDADIVNEGGVESLAITKGDLWEVSVVTFPGNTACIMLAPEEDNPDAE